MAAAVLAILGLAVAAPTLWPERPLAADAIVVLSGGAPDPADLLAHGHDRVETGARLWLAGVAPVLVLSGDEARAPWVEADQMPALAEALGVDPEAILREDSSHSTLQNALFTRSLLGGSFPDRIVIVTDPYHLARAWASFRWAGATGIDLVATRDYRARPPARRALDLGREILAWGFNLARVAGWESADLLGLDPGPGLLR